MLAATATRISRGDDVVSPAASDSPRFRRTRRRTTRAAARTWSRYRHGTRPAAAAGRRRDRAGVPGSVCGRRTRAARRARRRPAPNGRPSRRSVGVTRALDTGTRGTRMRPAPGTCVPRVYGRRTRVYRVCGFNRVFSSSSSSSIQTHTAVVTPPSASVFFPSAYHGRGLKRPKDLEPLLKPPEFILKIQVYAL